MSQSSIQGPALKKQSLYILAFKDDGKMIKIGMASVPWSRIASFSSDPFDLSVSYLVKYRPISSSKIKTLLPL